MKMASSFQTDKWDMSGSKQQPGEKELVPWEGPEDNDESIELDTSSSGWDVNDMFKKNEEIYGVVSDFDNELPGYTMPLCSDDTESYKIAEAKANEIVKEIGARRKSQAFTYTEESEENKYAAVIRSPSTTTNLNKKGRLSDSFHYKHKLEKTKEVCLQSPDSGSHDNETPISHLCPLGNKTMNERNKKESFGSRRFHKSRKNKVLRYNENQNKQHSASNEKLLTNEHLEASDSKTSHSPRPSLLTTLLSEYHSASEENKSKQPVHEKKYSKCKAMANHSSVKITDLSSKLQNPPDSGICLAGASQRHGAVSELSKKTILECRNSSTLNPDAKPFVPKSQSISNNSNASISITEIYPQSVKANNHLILYTSPEKSYRNVCDELSPVSPNFLSHPASETSFVFPHQQFTVPNMTSPSHLSPLYCHPVDPINCRNVVNYTPVLSTCYPSSTSEQRLLPLTGVATGNYPFTQAYCIHRPQVQLHSQSYPSSFSSTSEMSAVIMPFQNYTSALPSNGLVRQGITSNACKEMHKLFSNRPMNTSSHTSF